MSEMRSLERGEFDDVLLDQLDVVPEFVAPLAFEQRRGWPLE